MTITATLVPLRGMIEMQLKSLKPEALAVLKTALRIGPNGRRQGFCISFTAEKNSPDHLVCMELEKLGLMREKTDGPKQTSGTVLYAVTYEGRSAMKAYQATIKGP